MTAENSTETTKNVPGRPFPKGKSGNPGGRPRKDPQATEILKAATPKAAEKLVELLESQDEKIVLSAANAILDRTLGKAEAISKLASQEEDAAFPPPDIIINFVGAEQKEELQQANI